MKIIILLLITTALTAETVTVEQFLLADGRKVEGILDNSSKPNHYKIRIYYHGKEMAAIDVHKDDYQRIRLVEQTKPDPKPELSQLEKDCKQITKDIETEHARLSEIDAQMKKLRAEREKVIEEYRLRNHYKFHELREKLNEKLFAEYNCSTVDELYKIPAAKDEIKRLLPLLPNGDKRK